MLTGRLAQISGARWTGPSGDGIEIITIPKGEEYCALPLLEAKPNAKADSSSRARGLMWVGVLVVVGALAVGAWLVGG